MTAAAATGAAPAPDGALARMLLELLACVCERFREDGRPVCRCCPYHGEHHPPADDCDCDCGGGQGRAWVRLANLRERDETGQGASGGRGGCGIGSAGWEATVELGVYRCVEVPGDGVSECSTQEAEARNAWRDLASMLAAARCCPALEDRDAVVAHWDPIGPGGGCAGSVLNLAITL